MNSVNKLDARDQSRNHVGDEYNFNLNIFGTRRNSDDSSLLHDLLVTEPAHDLQALKRKKGNRVEGTCEWILKTRDLATWVSSPIVASPACGSHQIIWLHGNPGQGKSTMAIYIIDALSTSFSTDPKKVLSYYLCDTSYATRRTAQSVIRGLLWHLYTNYPEILTDWVRKRYEQLKRRLFEDFDSLWTLLMETAKQNTSHHIFCVMDALDECEPESREDLLRQIQITFSTADGPSNIRFLILSRRYVPIENLLGEFTNQDLASFSELNQDIHRYIDHKLEILAKTKRYPKTLKENVKRILEANAQGTFLWVGLACRELQSIASVDVMEFLDGLPKELELLYSRIFHLILNTNQPEANDNKKILSFVATSMRPMSLLELSEACDFNTEEDEETRTLYMRDRINKCQLIVEIITVEDEHSQDRTRDIQNFESFSETNLNNERVALLHKSVKDFICRSLPDFFISEESLHAMVTYRCLDELMSRLSRSQRYSPHDGLLKYAICYWPYHARFAQEEFNVQENHMDFFSDPSLIRHEWLEQRSTYSDGPIYSPWFSHSSKLPLLNMAALWAIPSLIYYYITKYRQGRTESFLLDFVEFYHHNNDEMSPIKSPLTDAVSGGCKKTMRLLLDIGLRLTPVTLEAAATHSRSTEMVHLLLKERVDEIVQSKTLLEAAISCLDSTDTLILTEHGEFKITKSIFHRATANERHGPEVLGLLLDRFGDDLFFDESLLEQIIEDSTIEVISFLLERYDKSLKVDANLIAKAAIAFNGPSIINLLLTARPNDIFLTEDMLISIINIESDSHQVLRILKILFKSPCSEPQITDRVLSAAAEFEYEDHLEAEVFKFILEHAGNCIEITDDIIMTVARYPNACAAMPLLLRHQGVRNRITEEVLTAAIPNMLHNSFFLLVNAMGCDVRITEEMLNAAAKCWDTKDFSQLLEMAGDSIQATQDTLIASLSNDYHGPNVMHLSLARGHGPNEISTELLQNILTQRNNDFMSVILARRGKTINLTKNLLQGWMQSKDISQVSLKYIVQYQKVEVDAIQDAMATAEQVTFVEQRRKLLEQSGGGSWDDLYKSRRDR